MLYNVMRKSLAEIMMFYFIAKPLKGRNAKLHAQIEERMKQEKLDYRFLVTSRKGEERELAAAIDDEEPTVIAVGGDGTLNGVLCGLKDPARCTLGIIPAGTGNDFAAVSGIPHGIAALDLILKGTPKYTDYLAFSSGLRSLNIAGVGIDVDILLRCNQMKHFHAKSKYFLSLLTSLRKFRGLKMKIEAEGKTEEGNFLIAAVCNGRQFGGGIPICPPAKIDDGKLDLVYVTCPKHKLLPLLKLMRGKVLSLPIARHALCEEATLTIASPFTAQYDGELYEESSFEVKLIHRELKLFRGENESV